jgi:hypothetical protein
VKTPLQNKTAASKDQKPGVSGCNENNASSSAAQKQLSSSDAQQLAPTVNGDSSCNQADDKDMVNGDSKTAVKECDKNATQATQSFGRTRLLLSVQQMFEEGYPMAFPTTQPGMN